MNELGIPLASLVAALALLIHALRGAIPGVLDALKSRADVARLDATARADAASDMRERLDESERKHAICESAVTMLRTSSESDALLIASAFGRIEDLEAKVRDSDRRERALHEEISSLRQAINSAHPDQHMKLVWKRQP